MINFFNYFSNKSRSLKIRLFRDHIAMHPGMRVLDLGGELEPLRQQLMTVFHDGTSITVVNIELQHLELIRAAYPEVVTVCADARRLPFKDQSFDIIYSNAVIEHLGGVSDQRMMAREIMRVGRAWFVTTPNRWFPYEFHMRLPFVSWLGPRARACLGRIISWNHMTHRYSSGLDYPLHLLSARDLRALFPSSRILRSRVTFWPETLVVIGDIGSRLT